MKTYVLRIFQTLLYKVRFRSWSELRSTGKVIAEFNDLFNEIPAEVPVDDYTDFDQEIIMSEPTANPLNVRIITEVIRDNIYT